MARTAVAQRAAELYAALNVGVAPDDPAHVHTYGERTPDRDYFSLWTRYTDDRRREIEVVAYHDTLDLFRRYVATYGPHTPTCRWAYAVPAGVEIATDEPEGWTGWRPPALGQLELLTA